LPFATDFDDLSKTFRAIKKLSGAVLDIVEVEECVGDRIMQDPSVIP
jgi:hypothetical protein